MDWEVDDENDRSYNESHKYMFNILIEKDFVLLLL